MLDILNRCAHGFVAVPVILSCRRRGVLAALRGEPATAESVAAKLGANPGHLQVALRMLESLGWVDRDRAGRYHASPDSEMERCIPDGLDELLRIDMDAYLARGPGGVLARWTVEVERRWQCDVPLMADLLDGALAVPVLVALAKRAGGKAAVKGFAGLPQDVGCEVEALFCALGWLEAGASTARPTPIGTFMFERAMNLGVAASYRPMLAEMDAVLFGNAAAVFAPDGQGRERHVDRSMNVLGSGFMHDRYFSEVEGILVSIFSREPLSAQPRYVADMGSGDGTFLRRVYETVRRKTPRGRRLADFPLTMIGIDLNEAALEATSRTLADIDHLVLQGDVGAPRGVVEALRRCGVDPDRVLHIRSFLDHDRAFVPPTDRVSQAVHAAAGHLGAYVDRSGASITPAAAVQSLTEHLLRWAEVINEHGCLMLEVHCLDPLTVRAHRDQSESLYFDAVQGFSQQLLVEPDAALMAAAEAGLYVRREQFRRFPALMPYCRITLGLFERRPYRVRMARPTDLSALVSLEALCWAAPMRATEAMLRERIHGYPAGQWVLEMDDEVVGVLYSQRISSIDPLRDCRLTDVAALRDDRGSVVQLLALNVRPDKQHLGLGDQLLDLILMRSSVQGCLGHVAGLTRCKDFRGTSLEELAEYVERRDGQGRPLDPILRFHFTHGARLLGPVPGFRPEDAANLGAGVLVCYDLIGSRMFDVAPRGADPRTDLDTGRRLERCLRELLGPARQAAFSSQRPLRELGLDSLDLLEFRTLLQHTFARPLSPTFFFSHPTLKDIEHFFRETDSGAMTAPGGDVPVRLERATRRPSAVAPLRTGHQPGEIAIVGMAARLPGAADVEGYWELLREGRDAITEVPGDRWPIDAYYDSDPDAPNRMVSRHGGFLENVAGFDAGFFGIPPLEARLMDPQQRLLLEVHWEAIEHAGVDAHRLRGARCGFYVGLYTHDYETLQVERGADMLGAYSATGNSASLAAGRLAYFFGTHGPAMTIDTACSSSLVAVHQAVQGLRTGDCDVAMASGVNLILSPRLSIAFSKAGMLAPDGRCKTFDSRANGYVRSEGCAAVVLKRLDDAVRDGDRVLAVLRGTAVNQDGASNGLTAPSLPAQQALVRRALADAGLQPSDIDYVEAHGTGTSLGDPIEYDALRAVFGADPRREAALWIGSAKTNIGHTEAVAGLAGLIKVVLSMRHGVLPAHLHFAAANPLIDLDNLPARIPIANVNWPASQRSRRAGVSSFGFSGTNAHVIVEEAQRPPATAVVRMPVFILPVSAESPAALRVLAERFADWLPRHEEIPLADICGTAGAGRAHHSHRLAVVGRTHGEMASALRAAVGRVAGSGSSPGSPRIGFLFTGQGSQYLSMARELAAVQSVFREALAECGELLAEDGGPSLAAVIYPEPGQPQVLDDTANTQPALFAIEYALARMLESFGITPAAVMGHSVGEYAAACVAGVLDLRDGLKLIASRGRLMGSLPRDGAMAAVLGPADAVRRALDGAGNEVAIGAFNGPGNTVLSGRREALESLGRILERQGAKVIPLQVSHAFHSPLMEPIMPAFLECARGVKFAPPRIPLVSNLTGAPAGAEILTPEYWTRHLRQPVRFEDGLRAMRALGTGLLLEIGPHPVLSAMGRGSAQDETVEWLHTLERGRSDWECVLAAVGRLYERGVSIDWMAVGGAGFGRCDLPKYAWQRKRYWFTERHGAGSTPVAPLPPAASSDLLFQPIWVARSVLGQASPARRSELPPADEIVSAVASARDAGRARCARTKIRESLDAYCSEQVMSGLCALGWMPVVGETVGARALVERLGVMPRYERFLTRALAMLAEDGWLERAADTFVVTKPFCADVTTAESLATLDPSCSAELKLVHRTTRNLARVLKGEIDILELIFPGGALNDALAVYTQSPFATLGNDMVAAGVRRIVAGLPAGRTLRILEIGAGTGGTTAALLPLLKPDATEYVLTDVSSAFLDAGRNAFRNYPFVRFEIFDAEIDAAAQGFAPGTFDLVIASNVLHATADLRASVARAVELLAPGGSLLLLEGLEPTRWVDLVFGLTEGWWRFRDTELRADYPLLDSVRWHALLRGIGLSAVAVTDTAPGDGKPSELSVDLFRQGVVTARRLAESAPTGPSRIPPAIARSWLVIADDRGIGSRLAERLEQDGERCVLFPAARVDSGSDGTQSLLAQIATSRRDGGDAPLGVVDCSSISASSAAVSGTELLAASTAIGMRAIEVVRIAARLGAGSLWLVTRGARGVHAGEAVDCVAATLTGVANVARAEYPKLDVRSLDVDADLAGAVDAIYRELRSAARDVRVAWRGGQRFVMSLAPAARRAPLRCSADGTYVIVGGMGDLGLHTAEWLADAGAKRLVLVGRTPFPPRNEWPRLQSDGVIAAKIAVVRRLEAAGVALMFPVLDICEQGQLKALVDDIHRAGWGPIRGAVQAAAVIGDQLISDVDAASYAQVLGPKIAGTCHLVESLSGDPLDFLALYSSIGAVVGLPGQASYGAANAFLDALAASLRARGTHTFSINWCGWTETGLTRTAGGRRAIAELALLGIQSVSAHQAPALLEQAFSLAAAQATVIPLDPGRRDTGGNEWLDPLIAELLCRSPGGRAARPREVVASAAIERGATRADAPLALDGLTGEALTRRLELLVRHTVAELVDVDPDGVDFEGSLGDMGMDSLLGLEFRKVMQAQCGIVLSATLVWNFPTVKAIVAHIAERMGGGRPDAERTSAPPVARRGETAASAIANLSEEEALRQLVGEGEQR